MMMTMMFMM